MDENQNTETQLTQKSSAYAVTTGKYNAKIAHSLTILGILMIASGLFIGMALNVGLGILIVITNLCSTNLYLEFTKDSLVTKLVPFQKALTIPYRKIKAVKIGNNVIELTLNSSNGDKTKKVRINRFSADDRERIKVVFDEFEKQL